MPDEEMTVEEIVAPKVEPAKKDEPPAQSSLFG
jgi:hypothetical protein